MPSARARPLHHLEKGALAPLPAPLLVSTPSYSPSRRKLEGGYCPMAVHPMPLAPATSSYCSTAPFSVVHAEISRKLDQIEATLARCTGNVTRTLMEPLSHSPLPPHCGGSTMLSACDLPSDRARLTDCLKNELMAPLPALPAASMPSYSPSTITTMGGGYLSMAPPGCSTKGSMAPTPAHHGAEMPSSSSARPPSLAQPAPSHPQRSMGGS